MKRNQRPSRRTILCLEPLEDRCLLSAGYTLVDLGGLPGLSEKQSSAVSINEAGDIAGNSYTAGLTAPTRHPVVWHKGATGAYQITDLGLLPGSTAQTTGFAFDINNRGEVIGRTAGLTTFLVRPEDTDSDGRPDRWYRDANGDGFNDLMINLTALNGGAAVSNSAINDQGQMIGQYMLNQFDGSGNIVTNSSVGGQDINNNGQIIGNYYHDDGPGTPQIVVQNSLWLVDAAGNVISGPTALGMSGVAAINASGSAIVGGRQVWQAGAISDLGTLGGSGTEAWAVNDAVQVVGRSTLKSKDTQAFVWQGGTMTNLNKYLPRNSGWTLYSASRINNAGWIVGDGRVSVGKGLSEAHGFLMIPASNLMAAAQATGGQADVSLSPQQVQPLLSEALLRWQTAGVDVSSLHGIDIRIADLPGATLGQASGHTIWLDANAAGWGWFVDRTPRNDSEFTTRGDQGERRHIDLLTVLEHELGHIFGYDHTDDGIMSAILATGVREMPMGAFA